MTIRRVTAPAIEPVTLPEAKAHLRVDGSDEDALISGLISAAVGHFDGEGTLGRAMISQEWAQYFSPTPYRPRLIMGPFIGLTEVAYYDASNALQTDTLSNYEAWLDGDFVIAKPKDGFDWPDAFDRPDAIKISYNAGFGVNASDVPQAIRQAILLTIGHWYEHRMSVSELNLREVPMAAEALMNNQRVGWYG